MALRLLRPIPIPSFFTLHLKPLSTCATRYPFLYELIDYRPKKTSPRRPKSGPQTPPELKAVEDKAKRKYLAKRRRRRMYGTDSEDERKGKDGNGFVELEPVVMEFKSLHQKEEELFFYDAFCYPWEKKKHYHMVYRMERRLFPGQCFDRAFLEEGEVKRSVKVRALGGSRSGFETEERNVDAGDDKGTVFFEDEVCKSSCENGDERKGMVEYESGKVEEVLGMKVRDLFKSLKKVPTSRESGVAVEVAGPYLSTRSTGLPARWDGPYGTVVLVNKPKGVAILLRNSVLKFEII